jgi:hypothetical protein
VRIEELVIAIGPVPVREASHPPSREILPSHGGQDHGTPMPPPPPPSGARTCTVVPRFFSGLSHLQCAPEDARVVLARQCDHQNHAV